MTAANDNLGDYNPAWISPSRRQAAMNWFAVVKEEALKIDPATAEVDWSWVQILDPYGLCDELPKDCRQTGRLYFAHRPGSGVWVEFGDLPDKTAAALVEGLKSGTVKFVDLCWL